MSVALSEKTLKTTYKGYRIHIHDVKFFENKWFCTVTITTPIEAPEVNEFRLPLEFGCTSDKEAIDLAENHAVSWIKKKYF